MPTTVHLFAFQFVKFAKYVTPSYDNKQHPKANHVPNPYYVIAHADLVTPRFFLFYNGSKVTTSDTHIAERKCVRQKPRLSKIHHSVNITFSKLSDSNMMT